MIYSRSSGEPRKLHGLHGDGKDMFYQHETKRPAISSYFTSCHYNIATCQKINYLNVPAIMSKSRPEASKILVWAKENLVTLAIMPANLQFDTSTVPCLTAYYTSQAY